MVVQFFKGGRTKQGAKSAVDYLLNERLEQGTAKVYEGNPDLTLKIINSTNRKWKFTSGVISFEEPYEKIKKVLPFIKERFEETFFAGLEKDQYNILYVLHTDKGRAELHFIVPRMELTTGKDLAIYTHKKDLKKKDLFQQYINLKYELSNPLAKEKQETLKIEEKKWSNENKEFKKQLHEVIEQGVLDGVFSNREEIVFFLKKNGIEVKREGKNYITIINPSNQKSVRLKGEYYDETWSITRTIEKISRREERESLVRLGEKLRERVARDAEANRKKYSKSKSKLVTAISAEAGKYRLGVGAMQDEEKLDLGNRGNYRRNIINNSDNLLYNRNNNDDVGRNKLHEQSLVSQVGQTKEIRSEDDIVRREAIRGIIARREIAKQYIISIDRIVPRTKSINSAERTEYETIKPDSSETRTRDRKIDNIINLATATNRQIDDRIKREHTADEQIIELEQRVSQIYRAFNRFIGSIKRGFELMLNRFKYKHSDDRMQQQPEEVIIPTHTFKIRR